MAPSSCPVSLRPRINTRPPTMVVSTSAPLAKRAATRIDRRPQMRLAHVDEQDIGALAGFERADLAFHGQGARAPSMVAISRSWWRQDGVVAMANAAAQLLDISVNR